jgi:hypothetical protein
MNTSQILPECLPLKADVFALSIEKCRFLMMMKGFIDDLKIEIEIDRSRFLNYKTRVVFKIFSNTNILSEILINSEIIRGASQYTKCGGCRGYYGNNINKFGKKQFSSLKCAKTFQKK